LLLAGGRLAGADSAAEGEARLRQAVEYLASDELEGRGVGTAGLDRAAQYIAEQFTRLGLRTDLFDGTPFQEFKIDAATFVGPAEHNRLAFVPGPAAGKAERIKLVRDESFRPLAIGGNGEFAAPLVFAGYGITAKELKRDGQPFAYDDYAGLDVQGNVVILLRKEPQQTDPASPFDGDKHSAHATFQRKLARASELGAAAVIFVNDSQELAGQKQQAHKLLTESLNKLAEARKKLPPLEEKSGDQPPRVSPELAAEIARLATEIAEHAQTLGAPADPLLPFQGAGTNREHRKLPVFFCTRGAIDPVIQAALGADLATLEAQIDADLKPRSAELKGWRAEGEQLLLEHSAKNVVAVLEGHGSLADETIVLGAHYDHLGYGGEGSLLGPWTRAIHNGADDNASGVAALLEAARQLAAGEKPRRRIVFIAFAGEELGLYGSAYYTRHPRFPLEKTVAMLNLDMVGRLGHNEQKDELIVYGTGTAKEFDGLVERLAKEGSFVLEKEPEGFGPSDHSSFYAKKIPVLHLFTGTHRDYHRPSDDVEKLNVPGMRRVAELLIDLTREIDRRDERPTYVELRQVAHIGPAPGEAGPSAGERPSFGSMPAYPNPAKDGVMLEAVLEGSAAEKAGVKGGDVLTHFGETRVMNLQDFESALRQHKPGDKVKVKVRRGSETIETEVTLGRRRGG
jgi:hypothetical protein